MRKIYILFALLFGYIFVQGQRLSSAEYFFGADPGVGQATSLSITQGDSLNQGFGVPISALSQGFNNISVRVKDSLGIWSQTHTKIFYKLPVAALAPTTPKVISMEYFVDTDPGLGQATEINFTSIGDSVYQVFSIPVSSLSKGFHNLSVRVQDSLGLWSQTMSKIFYKLPLSASTIATPKVMRMEYFVDADPGLGQGTIINFSTMGDSVYQIFSVPVSSYSIGFHNLSVRIQDSLGLWSTTMSKIFYVLNGQSVFESARISALEYYVDIDPGVGLATPLNINISDSINQAFTLPINGMDSGYHYLCVRAQDSMGVWSHFMADTFRVLGCNSPVANFVASQSICIGDTLNLTNSTTNTDQWISYHWDMENDGSDEFSSIGDTSFIYSAEGTYQIKLTATNSSIYSFGCVDTVIKTITVRSLPDNQITTYGSGTICPGSSVSIGASTGLGYTYQWIKDGSSIPNATSAIYNATSNGDYYVAITSFYGCKDTSSVASISMYSMPAASITVQGAGSFCYGDSTILQASTGTNISYLWYKNAVALTSDTLSTFTVTEPGSYKVQLTSQNGCNDESSPVIISVNPLPIANLYAMGNTAFCQGDSVELQTNLGLNYSYEWTKNGSPLTNDTLYQIFIHDAGNYQVSITDANGCVGVSTNNTIVVYQTPTSDFSLAPNICSSDTAQIQYTGTGTAGAFYNWNFDGATVLSGTSQGPYGVQWNTAGQKQVELTVSENGCSSTTTMNSTQVNTVVATLTSANSSVCQGDSVILFANGGQNYTYQWLQGGLGINNADAMTLSVLQTGNYSVEVTDTILGCSQISQPQAVNIYPTNFNLAFTSNNTTFTQPPFNVVITNQTPNLSNYQFDWELGDGNNSSFYNPGHNYQYNGDYTISLYAENTTTGCRDTLIKTDYISCTGGAPNPCTILAAISPAGPVTICNGDSFMLTANSGTGYSYQWVYNNLLIPNADSVILWAKQSGSYRVVVSDSVCSQTSPAFVLNHFPSIPPQIMVNGNIQPCTDDSLELYLPTSYVHYNWSVGDTNSSIFVKQTGYYTVAVQDLYGCNMVSQPQTINASFLQPPSVCIVGVDTSNHNRIIWERPANALIDSIFIYRESNIANQYNVIGKLDYAQAGIFSDTNSNPAIRAYRYRLAAKDTCGAITLMSTYHKTIHLTINAGLNGSWNLIWDGYTGFQFGSYRIYRGTSTSNMSLLTQLPSTSTSYTDLNPPSGQVYYQIEVVKSGGCYPDSTFAKANTNYNVSRSNTANNGNIVPIYFTADFNANINTGIWPIQVEFSDLTSGMPDSWHWNFGDGNTSIEKNPIHTYNNTGLYTVSLEVCNGDVCDTIVKTDYINVLPNGMVEIGVDMSAKLFPNPNDGNFTLEIADKTSHELQLHIYNSIGELVYQEAFTTNGRTTKNLRLNNLANGVYFVNLNTQDNIVYRTKVVIHK